MYLGVNFEVDTLTPSRKLQWSNQRQPAKQFHPSRGGNPYTDKTINLNIFQDTKEEKDIAPA